MEILEVHDPNRIKVQKRKAYFLPKKPTRLEYKVDFQNKAKGTVEDVVIRVPVAEELNLNTIEIMEDKIDPIVPACPEIETPQAETCYELETKTSSSQDSLIFTF